MFGICLGHQLLSISHGYDTFKLKFKEFENTMFDSTIDWQKKYEVGSSNSSAETVQQTTDGGYIVAGAASYIISFADLLDNSSADLWVAKLDSDGDIEWQKGYGGNEYEKI
jgi:carbamoylphosphate synthase small subunit